MGKKKKSRKPYLMWSLSTLTFLLFFFQGALPTMAWHGLSFPVEELNSRTTGAANTAVVTTLTAPTTIKQIHVHRVEAICSAGTAQLTIETPSGTTVWQSTAAEVGATRFVLAFEIPLVALSGNGVVITLGACGLGNTGTLTVFAERS